MKKRILAAVLLAVFGIAVVNVGGVTGGQAVAAVQEVGDQYCDEASGELFWWVGRWVHVGICGETPAPLPEWGDQFGSAQSDWPASVAVGSDGAIYVAGSTWGSLEGANLGENDAFVRRYDDAGVPVWGDQFGTSDSDSVSSVAVGADGSFCVAGSTWGALEGANAGQIDAFARCYDSTGTVIWTDQFGTQFQDFASVALGSDGAIYVAGTTGGALEGPDIGGNDGFLRRYDSSGTVVWGDQFSVANDEFGSPKDVRVGSVEVGPDGGVFVAGSSSYAGVFLRRYDSSGTVVWTKTFGDNGNDSVASMTVGSDGAVYVVGVTEVWGDFGRYDGYVRRFDPSGALVWDDQFGTEYSNYAESVAVSTAGDVYVASSYVVRLLENSSDFDSDVFLRRYTPSGEVVWDTQIGSSGSDEKAAGVAVSAAGEVYLSGSTDGTLESPNAGNADAFIQLYPAAVPSGSFTDDDGSIFETDIEWLADQGITRGCNPPDNTLFCPAASVTRGQMAAFLHRALDGVITPSGDPIDFTDTATSTFAADIDWLSAAGITAGCNPPTNDEFCPNQPVTRGQMAAFLVRALGYTDDGGGDLFTDDDASIFEAQIDRLATAGVTRGCNPPLNDRFCPTSNVTRAQMAAFLHRALG